MCSRGKGASTLSTSKLSFCAALRMTAREDGGICMLFAETCLYRQLVSRRTDHSYQCLSWFHLSLEGRVAARSAAGSGQYPTIKLSSPDRPGIKVAKMR